MTLAMRFNTIFEARLVLTLEMTFKVLPTLLKMVDPRNGEDPWARTYPSSFKY